MIDNIYYVYIYLDPRKPGQYVYGDYIFDAEPFYVGKGKGNRYKDHLKKNKTTTTNPHMFRKIRKILKEGLEPIIIKVETSLNEQDSLDLEMWMIWAIGQNNYKSGPLVNISCGGYGSSGWKPSLEIRHRMSKSHKGHIVSEETRKKIGVSNKGRTTGMHGKKHSQKTLLKMSYSKLDLLNPMYGKTHSKKIKIKMSIDRMGEKNSFYGKTHSKKAKEKIINANSKQYIIIFPTGEEKKIKNLTSFSISNNLNPGCMNNIANGHQKHHKGFRCEKI